LISPIFWEIDEFSLVIQAWVMQHL
jgi:hypothetical protein